VGEFWTEICAKKLPGFALLPLEEMRRLGVNFGKGLQLVNILRDREADAQLGRVYVRAEERAETFAMARGYLDDAERYTRALRPWRLRAACALPLLLARETLDLTERHPNATRVKVARGRVWQLLGSALLFRQGAH
jgi:farnesyl-diphosphate farnesyltransferase